jgi:hypothetical protein
MATPIETAPREQQVRHSMRQNLTHCEGAHFSSPIRQFNYLYD